MQKRLAIDKAAIRIAAEVKPILFLDTCVLLDAFRQVSRAVSFAPFKLYLQLLEKVKNKDVVIVINETVEKEYAYNAPTVVREQRSIIKNLNNKWNALRSMKQKKQVTNKIELSADRIIRAAETTVRVIMKDAYIISDYEAAMWTSYDAVLRHTAPAVRESQFKDAYIFQTCLDLGKLSGKEIIFCTVNTKDYADDTKTAVHPDIKALADANHIVVTLSLGEAYGRL